MNNLITEEINNTNLLLKKFNNRDSIAFGKVYSLFYDELFYFSAKLYLDSEISPNDIIQDIFVNLWEQKKQKFNGLINIKAYLFISIKNSFKNYLRHKIQVDKFKNYTLLDSDNFIVQVVETEIFSFISNSLKLLPEEIKIVFTNYLEGLETKEIALKLGKAESTIYSQRKSAIKILQKILNKDELLIIYILISSGIEN